MVPLLQPEPYIFNFWASIGVVLSSLPLFVVYPMVFDKWGLLSGVLFVLSTACTFFAINRLGLATAAATWCGTAIVVSFTFGLKIAGENLSKPWLAVPSIILLVVAITGNAFSGRLSEEETPEGGSGDAEASYSSLENNGSRRPVLSNFLVGIGAAVAAGFFGGLVLAPMQFAYPAAQGLAFVPSLALGNMCAIVATRDPGVGLSVAYPILQCGLVVAGLWGILLLGELRNPKAQIGFWISAALVLTGTILLAASKLLFIMPKITGRALEKMRELQAMGFGQSTQEHRMKIFFPLPAPGLAHPGGYYGKACICLVYNAAPARDGLNFTGLCLGPGGSTIKSAQQSTGARIEVQNNLGNLNGEHPSATDPSVHILIEATSEICQPVKGCHAAVMVKHGAEVRLKPDLTEEQMEQWRRKHAGKRRQGSSRPLAS
eukprot:jgi/Astpho2/7625/Aster-x0777